MKLKQLIHLFLILIVLVALVWVKQTHKPAEVTIEEYVPLQLSFSAEQVKAIDIIKPKGEDEEYVELAMEAEGQWKLKSLGQARADKVKIDEFLKSLADAKGEQRAKKKELFPDFGIGDDEAYQVKLKDSSKNVILDVRIGVKKAATAIFIRHAGKDEVFFTGTDLFEKMGISGDPKEVSVDNNFWASTQLLDVLPDDVDSIEGKRFKDGKETVTASVTRKALDTPASIEWRFSDPSVPFSPDGEKIKNFIESFKVWRAQRVADPAGQDFGFDQPQWQMTFEIKGKEPVVIKAGKTDESSKTTYLQVSSEPVAFLMSPYYYENMDADNSRFIADNPLKAESADKVSKLIVTADKKKYEVSPKEKTWAELDKVIADLKSLRPSRILFSDDEKKKVKSPSKFSIEILPVDAAAPLILDLGEVVTEAPKEYAAVMRGSNYAFAVSSYFYNQMFDNLNRLEPPPAEAPKKT